MVATGDALAFKSQHPDAVIVSGGTELGVLRNKKAIDPPTLMTLTQVPGLADIKRAAIDAGALGCSLSGSGPSLFALCANPPIAARAAAAMTATVRLVIGGEPQTYVSAIALQGARIVSTCAS